MSLALGIDLVVIISAILFDVFEALNANVELVHENKVITTMVIRALDDPT